MLFTTKTVCQPLNPPTERRLFHYSRLATCRYFMRQVKVPHQAIKMVKQQHESQERVQSLHNFVPRHGHWEWPSIESRLIFQELASIDGQPPGCFHDSHCLLQE